MTLNGGIKGLQKCRLIDQLAQPMRTTQYRKALFIDFLGKKFGLGSRAIAKTPGDLCWCLIIQVCAQKSPPGEVGLGKLHFSQEGRRDRLGEGDHFDFFRSVPQ